MISVQNCLDTLFLFFKGLKGRSSVREEYRPPDLVAFLTGYSVSGYEIRLYCQKKYYIREYWNWWIPNVRFCTYRVFSAVTNDAPELLRMACEYDVELPPQVPRFLSLNMQRKAAVQAYLDILIERMRLDQNLYSAPA